MKSRTHLTSAAFSQAKPKLKPTKTKLSHLDGRTDKVKNLAGGASGKKAPVIISSYQQPKQALSYEHVVMNTDPKQHRFHVERQETEWLNFLEKYGYVVLYGVLEPTELEEAKDLFYTWLEQVPYNTFDRADPSTWEDHNFPASPTTGIIGGQGIGQSDFLWFLRTRPRVRDAFARLWGRPRAQLICSFDGANAFRPWRELERPEWRTRGGWYHVDQNAENEGGRGKVCVQGLVNIYPCSELSGGLTVVPGSHKHHERLGKLKGARGHFVPVQDWSPLESEPKLVTCEAGDLCLWDSRTVHCNTPGKLEETVATESARSQEHLSSEAKGVATKYQGHRGAATEPAADPASMPAGGKDSVELLRIAAYICMTPREFATDEVLEARQACFAENKGSTHWPHFAFFRPCRPGSAPARAKYPRPNKAIQELVGEMSPATRFRVRISKTVRSAASRWGSGPTLYRRSGHELFPAHARKMRAVFFRRFALLLLVCILYAYFNRETLPWRR